MKFKTRQNSNWSVDYRRRRRLAMPPHLSTLPGEIAADAAHKRVETFKFLRKLKRLPRKPMTHAVLVALGLVTATGGCTRLNTSSTFEVIDRPGPSFYVHEFVLKDGTHCATSTRDYIVGGIALTCDWTGTKPTLERFQ